MGPDSPFPLAVSALLLIGVSAGSFKLAEGCKAQIRLNLRFAAVLLAAPAIAGLAASVMPGFLPAAFASSLLVLPLAAAALALSCGPRAAPAWAASLTLSASLAAGLYAALLGGATPALMVLVLASASIGFSCPWRGPGHAQTVAGALALLGGGLALSQGALAGAFALLAGGLLARALQTGVEQQGVLLLNSPIGRARF